MAHNHSGQERFGLSAALTTPFDADGKIDVSRALKHARARLDNGCSSVTLFGTTGEGSSIADAERAALLDAFIAGGFPASNIVVGVMENSVADAVLQSADALRRGCKAILLAPPSYFKTSQTRVCSTGSRLSSKVWAKMRAASFSTIFHR